MRQAAVENQKRVLKPMDSRDERVAFQCPTDRPKNVRGHFFRIRRLAAIQ